MPSPHQSRGKLRPLQLAAIIFLTVSGGPYGLEPLFTYVSNHEAFLLLLITPFLWDVPTILTVLELNSLMPVTGGYYQWVKHALGIRWAFYEGWWTWLYTFIDLAIYPVLFIGYAAFFFPAIALYKIPICLVIIWSSALLNILGIVPVGKTSLVLGILVLIPFFLIFGFLLLHHPASLTDSLHAVLASPHPGSLPVTIPSAIPAALHPAQPTDFPALSMGLYVVMWNFLGWDNATTYAGEVARPVRSYLVSVSIAFVLVLVVYLLTALSVHRAGIDPAILNKEGFPALGVLAGGRWLGMLMAAGGMASTIGMYSAVLLSVSRIPQVMADDRLLPARLCTLHSRFSTPYISIIASSVVVSILVLWTFTDLVVMDIVLYGAGLFLEFMALLSLRIKEPLRERPFQIPLNNTGLILMILLPVGVYLIALTGEIAPFFKVAPSGGIGAAARMAMPILVALAMLLSAEPVWRLIRWRNPSVTARRDTIPASPTSSTPSTPGALDANG